MVRGIASQNQAPQKVMVVDRQALKIIDSAVKMNELLDENIIGMCVWIGGVGWTANHAHPWFVHVSLDRRCLCSLDESPPPETPTPHPILYDTSTYLLTSPIPPLIVIEPLEKRRQPYHSLDAIYFVSPTSDVVSRIIEDFTRHRFNKQGYTYAAAHIFFTGALDDRLFHRLKSSTASRYIRTLKEFYLDFVAVESQCFILERPYSLVTFFGTDVPGNQLALEYSAIASQIASLCITLGEFPYIRYSTVNGFDRITSKLSSLVYDELDRYAKMDKEFPSETGSQRATLLIVDRTVDPVAPLLHEFTYQAMANDLLSITDSMNDTMRYDMVHGDRWNSVQVRVRSRSRRTQGEGSHSGRSFRSCLDIDSTHTYRRVYQLCHQ